MSIRITGPSESMGEIAIVTSMAAWTLENQPNVSDVRFMRSLALGSTALDYGEYQMVHPEKAHATFIEDEDLGLGRDLSQHQVRFGQMVINSSHDHESPDLVAVKPFARARDLQNEWSANTYVNSMDEYQRAFLPLGVWRLPDGTYNLLTLYEHGVKSYDLVFGANKDESPEALRPAVIDKAMRTCIYGLGYLHGLGMAHGDAQVNNLAKDNRRVRFIDLESARMLPRDGKRVLAEANDACTIDLGILFDSSKRVTENREFIAEATRSADTVVHYAKSYNQGLKRGSRLSKLIMPELTVSTLEYFENEIAHI